MDVFVSTKPRQWHGGYVLYIPPVVTGVIPNTPYLLMLRRTSSELCLLVRVNHALPLAGVPQSVTDS